MQCLSVQKELDIIVLVPDPVVLILPKVLILCAKAKHWDIQWLVVWWVRPNNKRNQNHEPGVVELGLTILLRLLRILYQLIQQKL